MTEKRFYVDDSGYVVIDNNSEEAFMFDTIEDCYACCDLLNEQHEENEQLKQQISELKEDVPLLLVFYRFYPFAVEKKEHQAYNRLWDFVND